MPKITANAYGKKKVNKQVFITFHTETKVVKDTTE
jgi:hypothetical protein